MEQFKPKSAEEVQKEIQKKEQRQHFEEKLKKMAEDKKLFGAHKEALEAGKFNLSQEPEEKEAQRKKFDLIQKESAERGAQRKEEEARTVDIDVAEQEKNIGELMKEKEAAKRKWGEVENIDVEEMEKSHSKDIKEKEAVKREEKIGEWKEEQKGRAKDILKKFFEKESASAPSELRRDVSDAEQEKLIVEAMYDAKAAKFMRESPSAPDYESALKQARAELTDPKEPEFEEVEIHFLKNGEMPDKIETELLSEVKRLEDSAKRTALLAKKLEKEIKEKGIDVNKMELSVAEQMKFKIKSLFDKKLRNAYKSFELARLAEDQDRTKAFELKMAVTKPGDYVKLSAQRAVEEIAMRRAEKLARSKKWSVEPPSWVKRV